MSFSRSFTIIASGFFLMVVSGFGGYYWASSSEYSGRITPRQTAENQEEVSESSEESSDVTDADSGALTPTSWEAFLEYEGNRTRMLGIKKNYGNVNFRYGPGAEHSIVATPDGGALLMPLDRVGNWYRSRLRDGRVGWIHKSIIRILQVPEPVSGSFREDLPDLEESIREQMPEDFEEHNRIRINATKVNMRQGPGVQFPIAGQLYEYQEARLMGKRNDWYRVRNRHGSAGWVRTDLVEPTWLTDPEEQEEIEVTTTDLRMSPEFQFREAARSNEPMTAKLLERQSSWFLVRLNDGSIGWIHEQEVNRGSQSSSSTPD